MGKPKRNKDWRRWKQDIIVKRRLMREAADYKDWSGYSGDFEYDDRFAPRWFDLLGSFYEFRSRTSWSPRRSRWDKLDFDQFDRKYYRPKSKDFNKKHFIDEAERFYRGLD